MAKEENEIFSLSFYQCGRHETIKMCKVHEKREREREQIRKGKVGEREIIVKPVV